MIYPHLKLDELNNIREKLEEVWENGSSKGQCWSTSVVCSILFGGHMMHTWVDGESGEKHYWNKVGDFQFDLTSDQYGGDGLTPVFEGKTLPGAPRLGSKSASLMRALLDRWV